MNFDERLTLPYHNLPVLIEFPIHLYKVFHLLLVYTSRLIQMGILNYSLIQHQNVLNQRTFFYLKLFPNVFYFFKINSVDRSLSHFKRCNHSEASFENSNNCSTIFCASNSCYNTQPQNKLLVPRSSSQQNVISNFRQKSFITRPAFQNPSKPTILISDDLDY